MQEMPWYMDPDIAETIMFVLAFVSVGALWFFARKPGRALSALLAAGGGCVGAIIMGVLFQWDEPLFVALALVISSVFGMTADALLRIPRIRFGRVGTAAAAAIAAFATPCFLLLYQVVVNDQLKERSPWAVRLVVAGLASAAATALIAVCGRWVYCIIRDASRGMAAGHEMSPAPARATAVSSEERSAVLRMVADGKITSAEAAELLDSLGGEAVPGDERALTASALVAFFAGVLVAAGFALPWTVMKIEAAERLLGGIGRMLGQLVPIGEFAWQSGYHVGFLGWLVLILGVLPALLVCVPVFDRVFRQALLRMLLACTGMALILGIALPRLFSGSIPAIGLWLCGIGFGVQVASAAGRLRPRVAQAPSPGENRLAGGSSDGRGRRRP